MMLVAGRMTAAARADIGARCSSPTVKRGSEAGICRTLKLPLSDVMDRLKRGPGELNIW
jgi:hypothetical protein